MSRVQQGGMFGAGAAAAVEAAAGTPAEMTRIMSADLVIDRVKPAALEAMGYLERAVALAKAMAELDAIIEEPTLNILCRLQNSPLGFLTDRNPAQNSDTSPYPPAVVKSCVIEALIHGVMPVGNEFNIISGRCYVTGAGYARKLLEYAGLTDLRINYGVPKNTYSTQKDSKGEFQVLGAVVPCEATWRLNGTQQGLSAEIPVKVNNRMGMDAVLGKAARKMRYRIWCQITGSTFTPEGEVDPDDLAEPPAIRTAAREAPAANSGGAAAKIAAAREATDPNKPAAATAPAPAAAVVITKPAAAITTAGPAPTVAPAAKPAKAEPETPPWVTGD